MKRLLIALMMFAFVLPFAREAEAAAEVSVDFFYDNLASDGNWLEVADYGYVYQPNVSVSNRNWRPYSDGYWAYTDVGWTWVSYENFGWATYHYGRWARLADQGWVWVPGDRPVWGPAWVSWRTGGDYIGWAPLPPGGEAVYEGRPINGHVDIDFDIGPAYYNFVDVRYIGEPVLRDRIFDYNQNVTYISNTVNVTNITYNNSTVYNYGPDYNTVNAYSTRPIQRLTLQRDANFTPTAGVSIASLTKVQGDKFIVGAPLKIEKSTQPIAPKNVKMKIAQPKFEHGWSQLSDKKVEAQLKQKMKTEDAKSVPPPTSRPRAGAEASAGASPTPGATAVTGASVAPSAAATATAGAAMTPAQGKGKRKNDRRTEPSATPVATGAAGTESQPNATPMNSPENRKRGKDKHGDTQPGSAASAAPAMSSTPAAETGAGSAPAESGQGRKGRKGGREQGTINSSATPAAETNDASNGDRPGRGKNRQERRDLRADRAQAPEGAGAATAPANPQGQGSAAGEGSQGQGGGRGRHRDQASPQGTDATGGQGDAAGQGNGRGEGRGGRNKNKGEPSPTASPTPAG